MLDHPMITSALLFAVKAHAGQVRKYTGDPYVMHPIRVAAKVAELPGTMSEHFAMVAAALLHDVLEDTATTEHQLLEAFPVDVVDLVVALTNVSKKTDGNRAVRKALDAVALAKTSDPVKLIKLADLIDNTSSIVAHDPGFAKKYLPEKAALLRVMVPGYDPLGFHREAMLQVMDGAQALGIDLG